MGLYDEILKVNLEIDRATAREVVNIIRGIIPSRARILLLSHTGSRAFGWSWYNYDYDIHGLIACDRYWDWMHLGKPPFDINIYEVSHLLDIDLVYRHGEVIMNLSNPFYLDPEFPFKELMRLVTPDFFSEHMLVSQINFFKTFKQPRAALHAYRLAIVPIHFMKKGRMELNVFKAAKSLKLKLRGLVLCRNLYIARHIGLNRFSLTGEEYEMVLNELNRLHSMFVEVKKKRSDVKWDEGKYREFRDKVVSTFY